MKILIAGQEKVFCLHIPLGLVCNRVGAALLASGFRHTRRLPDGSAQIAPAAITAAQMHTLLKTLRQSQQLLRQTELPLLDMQQADGSRIVVTL